MEATRKPSIRPTTITTTATTEPKRHQIITKMTPPTTPTTPDRVRRTAERERERDSGEQEEVQHPEHHVEDVLTVIIQICGPRDEDEEGKGCEAETHAEQLCATGGNREGNIR